MSKHKFVENCEGVHLEGAECGDYTLCGDAFEGACMDMEEDMEVSPSSSRIVTCPRCIAVIKHCRGVRFREHP